MMMHRIGTLMLVSWFLRAMNLARGARAFVIAQQTAMRELAHRRDTLTTAKKTYIFIFFVYVYVYIYFSVYILYILLYAPL